MPQFTQMSLLVLLLLAASKDAVGLRPPQTLQAIPGREGEQGPADSTIQAEPLSKDMKLYHKGRALTGVRI